MWLFDLFNKTQEQTKETPSVKILSTGWFLLNYDMSYDVFFKYYNLNPFVFACINKRTNDIWAKGFELTKNWWKTILNDEFNKLIVNSTSSNPREFIKRLARDYDITWNCYVYIIKDESWNNPIWLQALDPRYIKPVSDKFGQIIWYVQNLNWIKVFLKNEIFHLKSDNDIENEIVGKSRMTSLFIDIDSDQEARDSNLAFFKNNQTPNSIVVIDPNFEIKEWDQSSIRQKIKEMFEGWKYAGWKNKHRSLMMQWIKDIIKIQDKINDMEFLELRKFTLDVVSAVYEVPKSILWFTEQTNYSNWITQYDIYFDVIEALEMKFSDYLTQILQVFDPRYKFNFLQDNLRKLRAKSEIAWRMYKQDNIVTLNEAREIIQYEKVTDWDKFFEWNIANETTNIVKK